MRPACVFAVLIGGGMVAMSDDLLISERVSALWDGVIAPGVTYQERVDSEQSECERWLFPDDERDRFAMCFAQEARAGQFRRNLSNRHWVTMGGSLVARAAIGSFRCGARFLSESSSLMRILLFLTLPSMATGLLLLRGNVTITIPHL